MDISHHDKSIKLEKYWKCLDNIAIVPNTNSCPIMIWDFPVESLISAVCNIPTMRFDYVKQIHVSFYFPHQVCGHWPHILKLDGMDWIVLDGKCRLFKNNNYSSSQ